MLDLAGGDGSAFRKQRSSGEGRRKVAKEAKRDKNEEENVLKEMRRSEERKRRKALVCICVCVCVYVYVSVDGI